MADPALSVIASAIRCALQDANAALERLAALLADECRLLGQRAAPAQLERVAMDKLVLVDALEQAELARRDALHEAGYEPRAMERFLELDAASGLAASWQRVLARLQEVRAFNEANGLAIARSQALVSAELRLLHGEPADAHEAQYDATGARGRTSGGRIISSV
ncbi:MAG: flagellar protein FlgN [Nitrococcus sp.]|nr:flagellar protein FlgN [Nitrococcus sp.]